MVYKWTEPANIGPDMGAAQSQTGDEFRASIGNLESAMFDLNGGGDGLDDFPLDHYFAPNVYGRRMLLPAGSTIVGKVHRHAHLNVVISGHAIVATPFGREEVRGGDVFVSKPGTKRAVTALVDTVWLTIHPNETDTQDLAEIERFVIAAPTFDALTADDRKLLEVS